MVTNFLRFILVDLQQFVHHPTPKGAYPINVHWLTLTLVNELSILWCSNSFLHNKFSNFDPTAKSDTTFNNAKNSFGFRPPLRFVDGLIVSLRLTSLYLVLESNNTLYKKIWVYFIGNCNIWMFWIIFRAKQKGCRCQAILTILGKAKNRYIPKLQPNQNQFELNS